MRLDLAALPKTFVQPNLPPNGKYYVIDYEIEMGFDAAASLKLVFHGEKFVAPENPKLALT